MHSPWQDAHAASAMVSIRQWRSLIVAHRSVRLTRQLENVGLQPQPRRQQPFYFLKTKAFFEVEIDPARNLARTRYFGNVTALEMEAGVQTAEGLLPQLQPGFRVLADMTGLEAMDLDCVPHLTRFMDMCKTMGVALVIRVINDPAKDIGLNILSIVHYRGEVKILTCETLADAEKALL